MVFNWKIKPAWLTMFLDNFVVGCGLADGSGWVRHVWNGQHSRMQISFCDFDLLFECANFGAKFFSFSNQRLLGVRLFFLRNLFRNFVRALLDDLSFLDEPFSFII